MYNTKRAQQLKDVAAPKSSSSASPAQIPSKS